MKQDMSFVLVFLLFIVGIWFFVYRSGGETSQLNENSMSANDVVNTNEEVVPSEIDINTNNPGQINNVTDSKKKMNATLHTTEGDITIEFFSTEAPKTVANFLKLAGEGFYDGVKFHRVIKDFMNQTGDPLSKDDTKSAYWGTGGPGYKFADEILPQSDLYTKIGYKKGIVAMANSGPNTNGSQFFIMAADYPLPALYTIFGKVTSGLDVVTKINNTATNSSDRPLTPIAITSITLK